MADPDDETREDISALIRRAKHGSIQVSNDEETFQSSVRITDLPDVGICGEDAVPQ